jgi:hypothetical protein
MLYPLSYEGARAQSSGLRVGTDSRKWHALTCVVTAVPAGWRSHDEPPCDSDRS